jgi:hypothetical protein
MAWHTPSNDLIEISGPALGSEISLHIAKLLANDSDPEGDALNLTGFSGQSALGRPVRRLGDRLFYLSPPIAGLVDSFDYTVEDPLGAAASATVFLFLNSDATPSNRVAVQQLPDGGIRMIFAGISGRTYRIEASEDLNDWTVLGTGVAGSNGLFTFVDVDAQNHPLRFYRTVPQQ